jgi:hypothetical protein
MVLRNEHDGGDRTGICHGASEERRPTNDVKISESRSGGKDRLLGVRGDAPVSWREGRLGDRRQQRHRGCDRRGFRAGRSALSLTSR